MCLVGIFGRLFFNIIRIFFLIIREDELSFVINSRIREYLHYAGFQQSRFHLQWMRPSYTMGMLPEEDRRVQPPPHYS